ncbi:hypothetical protein OGAPHI_001034 [Ogataea philodendri]|uniref:C3H1-type domain-containing protein n=1 Tax=Ogataea philodendri TaxID=1378263 RepID=A0A9P8T9F1_9ASCO|nr:uncharacterized protein OGAPHI_001034 [Ogataea philodendri]KAH3670519.1 hypothetical protein OGAPHI_001034 [Ogataea philodendri]
MNDLKRPPEDDFESVKRPKLDSVAVSSQATPLNVSAIPTAADIAAANPPEITKNPNELDIGAITDSADESDDEKEIAAKTVAIAGTNIVLETEEDIQKWIEERRKNWPTTKRVEEKQASSAQQSVKVPAPQGNRRVCKFWQRSRNCRNGAKCKFLHETGPARPQQLPNHAVKQIEGLNVQVPRRFTPLVHKGKSLHNLVAESTMMDENNLLLQVFRKLADNNLLDDWDEIKSKLNLPNTS